ncbi:hypothetical protein ACA910_020803 [Epithemia clementina (nom. ined.)]
MKRFLFGSTPLYSNLLLASSSLFTTARTFTSGSTASFVTTSSPSLTGRTITRGNLHSSLTATVRNNNAVGASLLYPTNTRTMFSFEFQKKLPFTLTGPPIRDLCSPGKCQFGSEPQSVPLLEKFPVSSTSAVLRFGLPNEQQPLNLSTCACILAQAEINGETVVRPYTPISTNAQTGSFDLLIKNYGEHGTMSPYIHNLKIGDRIAFKHIDGNVKIQAEQFDDTDRILMLVGGTGITPMIQALHAILGQNKNEAKTKKHVTMFYGSRNSQDILGQELLDQWASDHKDQFSLHHVLSEEPDDSNWTGLRGMISKEVILQYFEKNADKDGHGDKNAVRVFVCGPPPLYKALSGPRDEKDQMSGVLKELGYTAEQVYKF